MVKKQYIVECVLQKEVIDLKSKGQEDVNTET